MTTTTAPDAPATYQVLPATWAGIHVGYLNGVPTGAGVEQCVLVIGPPRSGKTTNIVIPTITNAPGPVVATSTKADLVGRTLPWRAQIGRCWYFDPSGTTTPPPGTSPLRWSPITGCHHWDTALQRAHALTTASANPSATTLDSGHWIERGEALLAPLLHVAAKHHLDMAWVLSAVLRRDVTHALMALGDPNTSVAAQTLAGIMETDDRERSGIFSTTARILSAYRHHHTLEAAKRPNLDPADFVQGADTLYLVAPSHLQEQLAPIIVCLLDQIRHATYQRPPQSVPVVWALDEVANIAPLPDLPAIVAEGASQGLLTLACLQDLNQARARWGRAADGFLTLFGAKIALGGIADRNTLAQLSYLAGNYNAIYRTQNSNNRSMFPGWSQTIQQRPVIPAETIATLPPGWAYLAHTNHRPHLITLLPPPLPWPRQPRLPGFAKRLREQARHAWWQLTAEPNTPEPPLPTPPKDATHD